MYTLDYKLPFSTIALICEADYVAKIHFNFTYVSFLSLGVDWTSLFGRNVSGGYTTGICTRRMNLEKDFEENCLYIYTHTHARAHTQVCLRAHARMPACTHTHTLD